MEARKSFLLRIDPKLWAELEAWAQEELRSINGQIEYVLRQAVAQRRKTDRDVPPSAHARQAKPSEGFINNS